MRDGEFVQEYTRRGAPMRGRFRWRSNREKWQEIVAAAVIGTVIVLGVFLPFLMG